MQAFEFCRNEVAPRFSDWALCTESLAIEQRTALYGALCFASRVAEIPRRASEPQVAHTQIAWWKHQLEVLQEDDNVETLHPSLSCLRALYCSNKNVVSYLAKLIEHAEADMTFTGFHTREQWMNFWLAHAEPFWQLLLTAFGHTYSAHWKNIGLFTEWCQYLKHWPRLANEGVVYVSGDVLHQYDVTLESLTTAAPTQNIEPMLAAETRFFLCGVDQSIQQLDKSTLNTLRPLLTWLHLQKRWLAKTHELHYPLYQYRIELGWLEKKWTLWRL